MKNASHRRLIDLDLFPSGMVPKRSREALERTLRERGIIVSRIIASGTLMTLCGIFALFYGAFSGFAWLNHGHPAFGVTLSILSGLTLLGTVSLAVQFRGHLRELAPVPERLRREAEAESGLERAALDANVQAIFWNEAARAAVRYEVSEAIVRGLLAKRVLIERRRQAVAANLGRFLAATAPKLRIVPTPRAWGPVETIDLAVRDS